MTEYTKGQHAGRAGAESLAATIRREVIRTATPSVRSLAEAGHRSRLMPRRVRSSRRALPTFLIIGAQKAGTTSLHEYLAQHPDIGGSSIKEVQYFTLHAHKPLGWYRAHFPPAHRYQHAFESSPYYLFHPCCPQRIRAVLPEVRLIVLLRNPVDRAYSQHNHERALGFESFDFRTSLRLESTRLAGEEERLLSDPGYRSFAHQHYSYTARGMYARQLERWLECFPRSRMLILTSEDLFADPTAVVHRVQAWLGVTRHTPRDLQARGARSYQPLDPDLRSELAERFRSDCGRLHEVTGQRFAWE